MLLETVFGLAGMMLFAAMIKLKLDILEHFEDHEKVSMAKFFLDDRALGAFKVLVFAAMVFSVGMVSASTALVIDNAILGTFSKIGSVILFLGYIYFLKTIRDVTGSSG